MLKYSPDDEKFLIKFLISQNDEWKWDRSWKCIADQAICTKERAENYCKMKLKC